ncbi:MAG: type II toxin-antitoxin system VapC family toxin [Nitrospirae bacterium]|nr:type II toxin-antitoxin system VapC family toxin [Nitrospirota bacterium]
MILYLGTTSLIKLYVEDEQTAIVRQWAANAEIIATCRVAYAEVVAALDKRHKNGDLASAAYKRIYEAFTTDWADIAVVDFNDLDSGQLIKKHRLNRLAAMHLSAVKIIQSAGPGVTVAFSSTDDALCRAAEIEGLKVLSFH